MGIAKFTKENALPVGILILAFVCIVGISVGSLYARTSIKKVLSASVISPSPIPSTMLVEQTSSPSATPTASPSPTLVPQAPVYNGFCLYVPVLMYHHIQPWSIAQEKGQTSLSVDSGVFDQQMGYLVSHGYTTIFAEDLISALRNHTGVPNKSVVITIDDGYEDNYVYAFPVIKKYGIKTSLFVITGLKGGEYYTWDQLREMVGSGLVKGYNHTWSHKAMGTGNEEYEISTAQSQLQQNLGYQNTVFAYPGGTGYGLEFVHQLLAKYGITGAFSTIPGTYQCDSFIYDLHRTRIGDTPFPAYGL